MSLKCKFEHDGDCCNSGATQYMCKCKQPCDAIIPLTNAERIRSMTDEELAEFIPNWSYTDACELGDRYVDCNSECEKCVAEWLKQPYSEDA